MPAVPAPANPVSTPVSLAAIPVKQSVQTPTKSAVATRTKNPGSWSLDLEGTRDGITKAIQANAALPDADKAYLIARINAISSAFNFVELDAHNGGSGDMSFLHLSTRASTALI